MFATVRESDCITRSKHEIFSPLLCQLELRSHSSDDGRVTYEKSNDFESDVVQANTSFWAELKRRNVSKAGDCLRGHHAAADADNDAGISISRLMAQSHGLRRALTPGPIPCLFCDR